MGWKVERGGVLSDSLQVSKHSKPPRFLVHFDIRKKKGRHPMVTVQRLASTATPNLLSCLLAAKQGQINKSTSTIVRRLFHRTTSCFENPSSRLWTSQCARKTKKIHWECERSSSWKVPTNSCHLANCNCCAHLVIQLHVELWPSHHISMLDNPVWCLVMKQEVQIHRDLVVWWKSNTQPFVRCLEITKGSGHGHYRSHSKTWRRIIESWPGMMWE